MTDNRPLMLMMMQTCKQWQQYMRHIALGEGIPDPYRQIIAYLARHPGANQKALALHCQRTTAAISQTIKEMERTGYVRKDQDKIDQRATLLFLTDKGQAHSDRVCAHLHEADQVITRAITPEKEQEMKQLLELLSDTIRKEL